MSTKRTALLIGINNYGPQSGLAPLKYAEADAIALADILHGKCGFETKILVGAKASLYAINESIHNAGHGDTFLFFFAGHGQMLSGQYKLHPVDSTAAGLGALSFPELASHWQTECGYEKILVILDACRNEMRGLRGSRGLDMASTRDIATIVKGERWIEVLYGCSEGEVSYEADELGHGLLTKALIEVISHPPMELDGGTLAGAAADWMRFWSQSDPQHRLQQAYRYYRPSLQQKIMLIDNSPQFLGADGSAGQIIPAVCPLCGRRNMLQNTFRCLKCGKDHLCIAHQEMESQRCENCALKEREERNQEAARQQIFNVKKSAQYVNECLQRGDSANQVLVKMYGEHKTEWSVAAEKGIPEGLWLLGLSLYNGIIANKDEKRAVELISTAAELGYAPAQYSLGLFYDIGEGRPQNKAAAIKWYRKSAEQGYGCAQFALGVHFSVGDGVEKDNSISMKWSEAAAESGHVLAQLLMATACKEGRFVPKNDQKAIEWIQKAVHQGFVRALVIYGGFYVEGIGVQPSTDQATKLWRQAAKEGDDSARLILEAIGYGISPAKSYERVMGSPSVPDQNQAAWLWMAVNVRKGKRMEFSTAGQDYDFAHAKGYAQQGDPYFEYVMGVMHEMGYGTRINRLEAERWYRLSKTDRGAAELIERTEANINKPVTEKDQAMIMRDFRRKLDEGDKMTLNVWEQIMSRAIEGDKESIGWVTDIAKAGTGPLPGWNGEEIMDRVSRGDAKAVNFIKSIIDGLR